MFRKLTAEEQATKEQAQRDELFAHYGLDFDNYSSEQLRQFSSQNLFNAAQQANAPDSFNTMVFNHTQASVNQNWAIIRQNEELIRYSAHLAQQNEQIIDQNEHLTQQNEQIINLLQNAS